MQLGHLVLAPTSTMTVQFVCRSTTASLMAVFGPYMANLGPWAKSQAASFKLWRLKRRFFPLQTYSPVQACLLCHFCATSKLQNVDFHCRHYILSMLHTCLPVDDGNTFKLSAMLHRLYSVCGQPRHHDRVRGNL